MFLKPIETVDDLYDYLYAAIQLEHATIPPYLTALYSIHPGTNIDAYNVIRTVVVEEMLHLTLSANILNAIDGAPDLTQKGFMPNYPTFLPDGETDFEVGLGRFSENTINTFLKIERPAVHPEPAEKGGGLIKREEYGARLLLPPVKHDDDTELHFYSIGEFYHAIEAGLEKLCGELGEETVFCGDQARQVTPEYYYSGGGDIIPVYDLDSAKAAIRLISEQGEGYEGAIFDYEGELAHYYRFQQLILGHYYHAGDEADKPSGEPLDIDWDAVYPVKSNAKLSDYPEDSEVYAAAVAFNTFYKNFLAKITEALTGQPELLIDAVGGMFQIKEKAYQLIRNPIPDELREINAAPTFEIDLIP